MHVGPTSELFGGSCPQAGQAHAVGRLLLAPLGHMSSCGEVKAIKQRKEG